MKINLYKRISFLKYRQIASILIFFYLISLNSQDLKKEIQIPFPKEHSIDDHANTKKTTKDDLVLPESKNVKNYIRIPFPDDKVEKQNTEIEFKKLESANLETIEKAKAIPATNPNLPLEEIFVIPQNETKEANVREVTEKPTKDIGKALLEKSEPEKTSKAKPNDAGVFKKSKLYLGEYEKESKGSKDSPSKEAESKKGNSSKLETKSAQSTPAIASTNLPNLDKPSKKGKDKKKEDESSAPYERSKYYLNREDNSSANPELNAASSSDGEKANLAKMDQIRLLALDRKKNEAKNIIEGISEPEFKFKGLYELAVGLENSAKGDKKLKEEAIPFHLTIITEAPKTDAIVPKSLWALSHLLFKIGDHTPALDYLSEIILKHSNSEFADDAIYLSGRIYEESTSIRNLSRAKKYYELFMKNEEKTHFKNSLYLPFVKKRLELLEK